MSFDTSGLWQRTLAGRSDDPFNAPRARLRSSFVQFRRTAALLAGEIASSLPDYTVHDITHLDALWHIATVCAGSEFEVNPLEAWVLGGGFLLHDLAMSSAAYPGGVGEIEQQSQWPDVLFSELRRSYGRTPSADEIANPGPDVRERVIETLLRELHADRASRLPTDSWPAGSGDLFLIDDAELRPTFGVVAGQVASSHWCSVGELTQRLPAVLNPPPGFPTDWTVDAVKVACLLRVADAAHLTSERAPEFLRAIRSPEGDSDSHWAFQQHLQQPRSDGDRLVYTAASPFDRSETEAWWKCLDALRTVDRELRQVDSLLADTHRQRLLVKSVAYVTDLERIAQLIPAEDWVPIDARVRIGDVIGLVKKLGGRELYGQTPSVALRELVENASDAVRALRALGRDSATGRVDVLIGSDAGSAYLEVSDTGIGMSQGVLTGPFLDFGTSTWDTPLIRSELPGLGSSGFAPTGQYGIGFFAVFMIGDRIRVTTRRFDAAHDDTLVLEFGQGLEGRPVLRRAFPAERRADPGTTVRVWLNHDPDEIDGLLENGRSEPWALEELCAWLFPTLDVEIRCRTHGSSPVTAVRADDWKTLAPSKLIERMTAHMKARSNDENDLDVRRVIDAAAPNLRDIYDDAGDVCARACLFPPAVLARWRYTLRMWEACVTVGGARSETTLADIVGVFSGTSDRAARDNATPMAAPGVFAEWASEQAHFFADQATDGLLALHAASIIVECGTLPSPLPVAICADDQWVSLEDFRTRVSGREELRFISDDAYRLEREYGGAFSLQDDVLVVPMGWRSVLMLRGHQNSDWPLPVVDDSLSRGLFGLVIREIASIWDVAAETVQSNFSSEAEVRIGTRQGAPVTSRVAILTRRNLGNG